MKAFVAIYHLCELLFFSKEKEAPIAKEMVEWLNLTDKSETQRHIECMSIWRTSINTYFVLSLAALLKYDTQLIIHRPDPSGHPEFWEFVYK